MLNRSYYDNLGLPAYMWEGLIEYVEKGTPQGSFLMALLEGNFYEMARCADSNNSRLFYNYAMFFYNEMPSDCYGSAERVKNWQARKALGLSKKIEVHSEPLSSLSDEDRFNRKTPVITVKVPIKINSGPLVGGGDNPDCFNDALPYLAKGIAT